MIENMEARVRELHRAAGRMSVAGGRAMLLEEILGTCEDDVDNEVESGKVSLLPQAGVVPIASLPEVVSQCMEVPGSFRAEEDCWPEKRPGCCTQISKAEWRKLLARMMSCGMMELKPASSLEM